MNTSGEAAEQIVRMSLNGVEVAAKITGKGSLKLASILYNELKTQKHSKGKQRLTTMLRSGKQLKVYSVKSEDLSRFCKEAKKYGFPFCVLKEKNSKDGVTDIMVSADDGSKVNRIFERFNLSKVDQHTIDTEIERSKNRNTDIPVPDRTHPEEPSKSDSFVDELMRKPSPNTKEETTIQNPSAGRDAKTRQSEPSSKNKNSRNSISKGTPEREHKKRPSVRQELRNIKSEMEKKDMSRSGKQSRQNHHITPKKKKKINKKVR